MLVALLLSVGRGGEISTKKADACLPRLAARFGKRLVCCKLGINKEDEADPGLARTFKNQNCNVTALAGLLERILAKERRAAAAELEDSGSEEE